jgi:predicted dehydrogenase
MNPIRIGIIGAGGITKSKHLPGIKKISGVELVAVCNRSEASSAKAAQEWGIQRIETKPEAIIKAKDIDAVIIGTWPYLHCKLACAALGAGKHVFTQARMASSLAEAKKMLAAAKKHPKLVCMICPSPFGMKGTLFVKKLIEDGFLGKIRLVEYHQMGNGFATAESPITWRQQTKYSGVNTLAYGIYIERFLQWFGPIESVQATGAIFTPKRKNEEGKLEKVDIPEQLHVIAQLKNHPGQLNLLFTNVVRHPSARRCAAEIYGDEGTLVVDFNTNEILGASASEKELKKMEIPGHLERHWIVEEDFIDAIRAGGRSHLTPERTLFFSPDFNEGVQYMAVTEATIKSVKSGKREKVTI